MAGAVDVILILNGQTFHPECAENGIDSMICSECKHHYSFRLHTVSDVDGALSLAHERLSDFHSIVTQELTIKRGEFRGIPPVAVYQIRQCGPLVMLIIGTLSYF